MRRQAIALLGLATLLVAATAVPAAAGGQSELAEVRAATAAYHDVEAAVEAGYSPASGCVPNMGYHYLRDVTPTAAELDPLVPEILVYAPLPNGQLKLVAVEYATWESGSGLFGIAFDAPHPVGGPPFHTLHAWIWQANPDGIFAAVNPNVHCP